MNHVKLRDHLGVASSMLRGGGTHANRGAHIVKVELCTLATCHIVELKVFSGTFGDMQHNADRPSDRGAEPSRPFLMSPSFWRQL